MWDLVPGAPGARPLQLPVVVLDVAVVAGGRLVLRVPLSVVRVVSAVRDIASGRMRPVLPQQLCLNVGDDVLLLRSGRVRGGRRRRRERWALCSILDHQVVWVAPS